jgi:AcrR family transcriptional regulator
LLKISLEERKDYISKIATKVFSEKGYKASSLQNVSQMANISKAGLYHYFKSKEEILAYILIKNSDIFLEKLKRSIKESKEKGLIPQESFKKLIETYVQHVNSDKDRRLIVLRERHQLSKKYKDELIKREQAMFRLIRNELHKIPGLEKKINLNVITFLFISMSHWLGYWFKEGKELNLKEIIDQNIYVLFHGMLKR